ncbi:RNA polymerase II-binding domain family protein [Theileria parva strain Muguga]|uniref:CID domain-containing protein n=1 Tax=Theileria parva TaxID=5875 RepID=Q4MZW8_THEPA|nr:RNA polymerase II-binding domain family protein [Theileria parva strain Muguga]EAN31128.1 RNA polymerase II-binding domain family protein [Theileria parva strain Muguga]|eukprot:XP_763411.1 hypothetical protein [Theileria parva strain Muguga]
MVESSNGNLEEISDSESDSDSIPSNPITTSSNTINNSLNPLNNSSNPLNSLSNINFSNFNPKPNVTNSVPLADKPISHGDVEQYGYKYVWEYLQYHPDKAKQFSVILDHNSRKKKLEEIFPEQFISHKISQLDTTQLSIESFANYVMQFCYPPSPILHLFHDKFVSAPVNNSTVRLAIFYVYNHLVQTFTNENVWRYKVSFHFPGLDIFCIPCIIHTNKINCNNIIHICNCINIWRQRGIYSREVCDKLENITTNSSIIKSDLKISSANFNVNDELGYLNVLYNIFKMPLVDKVYDNAASKCDVNRIIEGGDNEYLQKMINEGVEEEFIEAGRLSGQELIILNSACLDLGGMIKENDENFKILRKEISKLDALLNRK